MVKCGLFVRCEANSGKEADVKAFLEDALPLAKAKGTPPIWYVLHYGCF